MNLTYLGPKGTFSEKASENLAKKVNEPDTPQLVLCEKPSIESVAKSVSRKEAKAGVMAYYNFLEGLVQETLDLIYENDLQINAMERLPIVFNAGYNGETSKVYSHPKALAQCSEWLWNFYPDSVQIPVSSTAEAVKIVKETGNGIAIASPNAVECLDDHWEDVGNKKQNRSNFTDFYMVKNENGVEYNPEKKYLSMIAITPEEDRPGILAEIMKTFAKNEMNCIKIHSRPALDYIQMETEPQMFYLEVAEHKKNLIACEEEISKINAKVKMLGTYEKPVL